MFRGNWATETSALLSCTNNLLTKTKSSVVIRIHLGSIRIHFFPNVAMGNFKLTQTKVTFGGTSEIRACTAIVFTKKQHKQPEVAMNHHKLKISYTFPIISYHIMAIWTGPLLLFEIRF